MCAEVTGPPTTRPPCAVLPGRVCDTCVEAALATSWRDGHDDDAAQALAMRLLTEYIVAGASTALSGAQSVCAAAVTAAAPGPTPEPEGEPGLLAARWTWQARWWTWHQRPPARGGGDPERWSDTVTVPRAKLKQAAQARPASNKIIPLLRLVCAARTRTAMAHMHTP